MVASSPAAQSGGRNCIVLFLQLTIADLRAVDASGLMGEVVDGHGIRTDVQVVSVLLRVVDTGSVAALKHAVGDEWMVAVCVDGRKPEELPAEGPQPGAGDGRRLLGEGTAGPIYPRSWRPTRPDTWCEPPRV